MDIHCTPSLFSWGDSSIAWIAAHRTPLLTSFFKLMTEFASSWGILLTIALLFWIHPQRRKVQYIAYALFSTLILNVLIKNIVLECRPLTEHWLQQVHSSSFPSGHAQEIVTIWWGLAFFAKRRLHAFGCFMTGLIVVLSRPYLGVHYPHDVIIGALLGLFVLSLYIFLERRTATPWITPVLLLSFMILGAGILIWGTDSTELVKINMICFSGLFLGFLHHAKWGSTININHSIKLMFFGLAGILCVCMGMIYLKNPLFNNVLYLFTGYWIAFGAPFTVNYLTNKRLKLTFVS